MDLSFHHLPDLPQYAALREIACEIAGHPEVIALWVGGSIARGEADCYSDVDLRVAVLPDFLDRWRHLPVLPTLQSCTVGAQFLTFGPDAFLHVVMLSTGETCDLLVQSRDSGVFPEHRILLECRDPDFARKLERPPEPAAVELPPATAETAQALVTSYWLNSVKHVKVLHRDLDLIALAGLNRLRTDYLRLCFLQHTGQDCGDLSRANIHGLTQAVRTLHGAAGRDVLAVVGSAAADRCRLCEAIDQLHNAVASTGRALSDRLGFPYPAELEAAVRRIWKRFIQDQGRET